MGISESNVGSVYITDKITWTNHHGAFSIHDGIAYTSHLK